MFKYIYFIPILSVYLMANNILNYNDGLNYYHNNQYEKAYPIILKEAKTGNKEAQYILANLFENGYGVKKDTEKSRYWYKKSASSYSYITKQDDNSTDIQINQQGLQFTFSKLDLSSLSVKSEVEKMVNRNFGILPFHTNFLIPFSYSSNKYNRHYSTYSHDNLPSTYDDVVEIEFQLSIQKMLSYNLLGFNEYLFAGYTQLVGWQAYSDSAPFRETNYAPEIFATFPTPYDIDKNSNLKAIQFGYRHQSNGQEGYRSRSWNRLFLASLWQWDNIFLKAQAWYRIPENKKSEAYYNGTDANSKGDDNPDIEDYLGYGDIEIKYFYGDNQFSLKLRNNLKANNNKGSIQLDCSIPIHNSKTTYWYIKGFNGYGESLSNYDKSVSKIGFGFALSRSLF